MFSVYTDDTQPRGQCNREATILFYSLCNTRLKFSPLTTIYTFKGGKPIILKNKRIRGKRMEHFFITSVKTLYIEKVSTL